MATRVNKKDLVPLAKYEPEKKKKSKTVTGNTSAKTSKTGTAKYSKTKTGGITAPTKSTPHTSSSRLTYLNHAGGSNQTKKLSTSASKSGITNTRASTTKAAANQTLTKKRATAKKKEY